MIEVDKYFIKATMGQLPMGRYIKIIPPLGGMVEGMMMVAGEDFFGHGGKYVLDYHHRNKDR